MLRSMACALAVLCLCRPALAQQMNLLDCQGELFGAPAPISGSRQFAPTSALGDGYVQFQGDVAAGGMQGSLVYQGYTANGAFAGTMEGPLGRMAVSVLDNTGGQMIIYDGTPSLGAPNTLGTFACNWQ
jgi:hypothetical protein